MIEPTTVEFHVRSYVLTSVSTHLMSVFQVTLDFFGPLTTFVRDLIKDHQHDSDEKQHYRYSVLLAMETYEELASRLTDLLRKHPEASEHLEVHWLALLVPYKHLRFLFLSQHDFSNFNCASLRTSGHHTPEELRFDTRAKSPECKAVLEKLDFGVTQWLKIVRKTTELITPEKGSQKVRGYQPVILQTGVF